MRITVPPYIHHHLSGSRLLGLLLRAISEVCVCVCVIWPRDCHGFIFLLGVVKYSHSYMRIELPSGGYCVLSYVQ